MIKIHPAASRYSADHGWLQSNFSFSFADYHDPANMSFGPLRVFNDDFIQPQKGFGTHPHRDMEIVTILLKGELKHEDNTGGKEILRPGEIQRMSAGTGILHSEVNSSKDETANVLQLWILPEEKGLTPSYEQRAYDIHALKNTLLPIVSKTLKSENIVYIHQDTTLFLSELENGKTLGYTVEPGRRVHLFVMEGEVTLNHDYTLHKRDAARISEETRLSIDAKSDAYFMLIDLP